MLTVFVITDFCICWVNQNMNKTIYKNWATPGENLF